MLRQLAAATFIVFTGCSSSDTNAPPSTSPGEDAQAEAAPDTSAPDAPAETAPEAAPADAPPDAGDEPCKLAKPYSSSMPACNACAEEHCCVLINACYADPACDDTYVNCMLACVLMGDEDAGDAGVALCLEDCATQAPQGKAEYEAAIGCADTNCATECN